MERLSAKTAQQEGFALNFYEDPKRKDQLLKSAFYTCPGGHTGRHQFSAYFAIQVDEANAIRGGLPEHVVCEIHEGTAVYIKDQSMLNIP